MPSFSFLISDIGLLFVGMFYFYFILSLCVVASCNQDGDWIKCKLKPGCSITQCDLRPASQSLGNDSLDKDYSILCQQNETSSSTTAVTEFVSKFDEIRIDLAKIEERLKRSEIVEIEMNSEITIMEKKNAETESELRNELNRVKKEVGEGKGRLNGAIKKITLLKKKNAEMERMKNQTNEKITYIEKTDSQMTHEMDTMKKEAEQNKGTMNWAMKFVCPVIYENKCFLPVRGSRGTYEAGVAMCKSRGGHLANIYSQNHMDDVMKFIRENQSYDFYGKILSVGMKYDQQAKKLTLRDGTDAPAGLKWYGGTPLTSTQYDIYDDYTFVKLVVKSDQFSRYQYLYNRPLSEAGSPYVICEIE